MGDASKTITPEELDAELERALNQPTDMKAYRVARDAAQRAAATIRELQRRAIPEGWSQERVMNRSAFTLGGRVSYSQDWIRLWPPVEDGMPWKAQCGYGERERVAEGMTADDAISSIRAAEEKEADHETR